MNLRDPSLHFHRTSRKPHSGGENDMGTQPHDEGGDLHHSDSSSPTPPIHLPQTPHPARLLLRLQVVPRHADYSNPANHPTIVLVGSLWQSIREVVNHSVTAYHAQQLHKGSCGSAVGDDGDIRF
ncbi:hypothetical protein BHE74_00034769 [Ensete ventricosum]|nr:hypothetical protein BHE74_00034769 [Ensete ventricosum]